MRRRRCGDRVGEVRRGATAPKLELARRLRREPTQAEQVLWRALRGRTLGGFKLRRQHIIAGFVVDFYCPAARLVIELDGAVHDSRQHYDQDRDAIFRSLGIRTMRFSNDDAMRCLPQVRDAIRRECQALTGQAVVPGVPPAVGW